MHLRKIKMLENLSECKRVKRNIESKVYNRIEKLGRKQ